MDCNLKFNLDFKAEIDCIWNLRGANVIFLIKLRRRASPSKQVWRWEIKYPQYLNFTIKASRYKSTKK